MAYHWRYGIELERLAGGDVRLTIPGERYGAIENSWTIPAAEWASIIASVSAIGETAEQYADALSFHGELIGRREPAGG